MISEAFQTYQDFIGLCHEAHGKIRLTRVFFQVFFLQGKVDTFYLPRSFQHKPILQRVGALGFGTLSGFPCELTRCLESYKTPFLGWYQTAGGLDQNEWNFG